MPLARVLLGGPNNYRWRSYRETLDAAGFTARLTTRGIDCISTLRTFRPTVLVVDPNIPWGGGDGVLAVRDAEPGLNRNLVMILTAGCDRSLLYRMSNYLIDDLVWQPASAADLHRRLVQLLEIKREVVARHEPLSFSGCSTTSPPARRVVRIVDRG